MARAKQQEIDLKQQIQIIAMQISSLRNAISKLPSHKTDLTKWKKQLINYNDLPHILNAILKLAADNHLFFSVFTPGESVGVMIKTQTVDNPHAGTISDTKAGTSPLPENNKDLSYQKIPIKIIVVGSYHQIAGFISEIANMSWIVVIGDFTISSEWQNSLLSDKFVKQAAAQNLLTAEMVLDIYYIS